MNELQTTNELVVLINNLELTINFNLDSAVYNAAQQGDALNKLKAITPHGEFTDFILANCTVTNREAQRRMRLAKENPELLEAKTTHVSFLSLRAHYALLGAPDEVKDEVAARLENNEAVTANEIKRLKLANESLKTMSSESMKSQQEALKAKEDWRQQYLDERNSKRDLAQELETVRISKKETIYIDDSTKALAQYREETDAKIIKLKAEIKKVNEEKLEAIKKVREDIHSGYDEEINRKQQQEMTLNQAITLAQQKKTEIDKLIMPRIAHAEALKNYRHYLNCLAVEASLIYERDFNNDELEFWLALFNDTRVMLNGCENELRNTRPDLKIVK